MAKLSLYGYLPKMNPQSLRLPAGGGGEGVMPYMGYIGMCRCEGYGFQAVYSGMGYINQSVWVSFFRKLISWLNILSRLGIVV